MVMGFAPDYILRPNRILRKTRRSGLRHHWRARYYLGTAGTASLALKFTGSGAEFLETAAAWVVPI
jgi:hypothetical protein